MKKQKKNHVFVLLLLYLLTRTTFVVQIATYTVYKCILKFNSYPWKNVLWFFVVVVVVVCEWQNIIIVPHHQVIFFSYIYSYIQISTYFTFIRIFIHQNAYVLLLIIIKWYNTKHKKTYVETKSFGIYLSWITSIFATLLWACSVTKHWDCCFLVYYKILTKVLFFFCVIKLCMMSVLLHVCLQSWMS